MAPLIKLLFMFLTGVALVFKSSLHRVVIDYFVPTAPPRPGYDYFKLALQWPPSVKPTSKLREFTIHGLWPDLRFARRTPVRCSPAPAFVPMGANLTALLHKSWPDVLRGRDVSFWRQEWNEHGKCSSKRFKQTPYFQLADNLRRRHNVLNYLSVGKIYPGNSTYQVQQIEKAVRNQINNSVIYMQCNTRRQLLEIRICFDASGTSVLSCPTNRGSLYASCGGAQAQISLPV